MIDMNVHERIRKTLEHEEPDRVPTLAPAFEFPFIKKVADHMDIDQNSKTPLSKDFMYDAAIHMGFDSIWYHYDRIKSHLHK